eukprot:1065107-Lingulodinium_polyedra.AAC.1
MCPRRVFTLASMLINTYIQQFNHVLFAGANNKSNHSLGRYVKCASQGDVNTNQGSQCRYWHIVG